MSDNKPLIYLDHNIYDSFTKNELQDLKALILESFQVVYSDENLSEITRSPEYSERFLKVLIELNAYYMRIVLDENRNITDRMHFFRASSQTVYGDYLKNSHNFGSLSFDQFMHKLSGGQGSSSFNEIIGKIQNSLDSLFNDLDTKDNMHNFIDSNLYKQTHQSFEQLKVQINAAIPNDKNFNAANTLRQYIGTEPSVLNNIQGNGALNKIFEAIKSVPGVADFLEILLGLDIKKILQPVNPNRTLYLKICSLYFFLEMLGYWSDRRLELEHRFPAFLCDQRHTANAMFTKALFTRDKPLAMKASAIYDYLEIGTMVFYIGMS